MHRTLRAGLAMSLLAMIPMGGLVAECAPYVTSRFEDGPQRIGNPTGVGPRGTERDAVRACVAIEFVVSRTGCLEGLLGASRGGCGAASA